MSYFIENSLFDKLTKQIFEKKSFLCVGLDPDPSKMPESLVREEDFLFKFNKAIVDATAQYAVAFKPFTNATAFPAGRLYRRLSLTSRPIIRKLS